MTTYGEGSLFRDDPGGFQSIRRKYNGSTYLLNPYSVMRYFDWRNRDGRISFWTGTSNMESIASYVAVPDRAAIVVSLLATALDNTENDKSKLALTSVSSKLNYDRDASLDATSLINFLILSGYLTFERERATILNHDSKKIVGYAFIPNEELREYWLTQLQEVLSNPLLRQPDVEALRRELFEAFQNTHIEFKTSLKTIFLRLADLIKSAAYINNRKERDYHNIVFEYMASFAHQDFEVISELEKRRKKVLNRTRDRHKLRLCRLFLRSTITASEKTR